MSGRLLWPQSPEAALILQWCGGLMDGDAVLRPGPLSQEDQGHPSVPQLPCGNGAALSHWSLPMVLFGNDNFCCPSVNRISSINHIYRLVCPPLLIPLPPFRWSMQTRLCTANPVSKMSIDGRNNLLIWDILIWEVRGFFFLFFVELVNTINGFLKNYILTHHIQCTELRRRPEREGSFKKKHPPPNCLLSVWLQHADVACDHRSSSTFLRSQRTLLVAVYPSDPARLAAWPLWLSRPLKTKSPERGFRVSASHSLSVKDATLYVFVLGLVGMSWGQRWRGDLRSWNGS